MGEQDRVVWPTRLYQLEGPTKMFMTIADVMSYTGWSRQKLRRLIRVGAFPRPRDVPGQGLGWRGQDIAAYHAIADLLGVGADIGDGKEGRKKTGTEKKHEAD